MTDEIFILPDGRKLGYATYGPQSGYPIIYFYGTPSSRLEPLLLQGFGKDIEKLLHEKNLRFIIPDRPGIGTSDYFSAANFTSFANDVNVLCGHLGIHNAASLSWSGGGPYALTHAWLFPEVVRSVFIFTGFTLSFSEPGVFEPMTANKKYFGAAKYIPWLMKPIMKFSGKKNSKKPMPQWISKWPDIDYNMLNDEKRMRLFSRVTTNESCRTGSNGIVKEAQLYFDKAVYDLSKMQQPVYGWWGTKDNVVLPMHYKAIQQQVKEQKIFLKNGEGHFSIYVNFIEEVLDRIRDESNPAI